MEYIISEIYKKLVPQLPPSDYKSMFDSIQELGQLNPIVQNKNRVILDGHTRLKICNELNIEPIFVTKEFDTTQEEEIYVIESNLKRRHLNSYQIAELGQTLQAIEAKYAKERKLSKLKNAKQPLALQKANEDKKGKTASLVAKKLGLSTSVYEKSLKIMKSKNEPIQKKVQDGKMTVQKAYSTIMNEQRKQETLESLKKSAVKLPKSANLHNIDFRDLKFKANSASLIFTDPPYLKKDIPLYSDMGNQAMEILRDGGSLCCFIGQFATLDIIERLRNTGLTFQWILACVHSGSNPIFFEKSIVQSWKPILWFTKGKMKKTKAFKDSIISTPPDKTMHKWKQSNTESDYYINALTEPGDIVYDPFMGAGTFGLSALELKRQFIGCELDGEHFATCKSVLSQKPIK